MICSMFRNIRSLSVLSIAVAAMLAVNTAGLSRAIASDAPTDPMASVKLVIDQAIIVFKDKQIAPADREQKLRSIAETRLDFQEMARSPAGYHWKDFTPEQRAEFVPLFTAFIEDAYLSRIETYSLEKFNHQIHSSLIQFNNQTIPSPHY